MWWLHTSLLSGDGNDEYCVPSLVTVEHFRRCFGTNLSILGRGTAVVGYRESNAKLVKAADAVCELEGGLVC